MASGAERKRVYKPYLVVVLLTIFALMSQTASAQYNNVTDIKFFGLLDFSSRFIARYQFEDQEIGSAASPDSFQTRINREEEFLFSTKSFIYHPGFLSIDFGGGPLLVQQDFDSEQGGNASKETLWNLNARLSFLQLKSYPFSIYYAKSHPTIYTSLAGRYLAEQTKYGYQGNIFELWNSTTIQLQLDHQDSQGSGFGSIVDEDINVGSIFIRTNYSDSDKIELSYSNSERNSRSGSPGLPINRSRILLHNLEIRANNKFGKHDKFELLQVLRKLRQEIESNLNSELDQSDYMANAKWRHSDNTSSFFSIRLNDSRRPGADSRSEEVDLGLVHNTSENLRYDLALNHEALQQVGFEQKRMGAKGTFTYSRSTSFGSVGLSGSLHKASTDQQSSASDIQVFDESLFLSGTAPVALANEFVLIGSVRVSNSGRTQTYVEGLDYRLLVIGADTSVQRLIGGNITDGETLLVDYRYETSGTGAFDTLNSGISLNVGFLETMNAYLRYNVLGTSIRSGELSNALNDRKGLEVGIGTSKQFLDGWTLSGQYRYRDQNEDISPFVSNSLDVNLSASLRGTLKITVAGSVSIVDYENSLEDVNLVTYRLGLDGRVFRRARFGYHVSHLRDTGGTLPRSQLQHRLNFQWAYRRVRFDLNALYSEDGLGISERNNTQITAQLTRTF